MAAVLPLLLAPVVDDAPASFARQGRQLRHDAAARGGGGEVRGCSADGFADDLGLLCLCQSCPSSACASCTTRLTRLQVPGGVCHRALARARRPPLAHCGADVGLAFLSKAAVTCCSVPRVVPLSRHRSAPLRRPSLYAAARGLVAVPSSALAEYQILGYRFHDINAGEVGWNQWRDVFVGRFRPSRQLGLRGTSLFIPSVRCCSSSAREPASRRRLLLHGGGRTQPSGRPGEVGVAIRPRRPRHRAWRAGGGLDVVAVVSRSDFLRGAQRWRPPARRVRRRRLFSPTRL